MTSSSLDLVFFYSDGNKQPTHSILKSMVWRAKMEQIFWFPESPSPVGIPATLSFSEQERIYGPWTVNRSYWSFCSKNDIRCSFNHDSKDANDKKPGVPERFIDSFEDILCHINFLSPRVPVTIVWNWHLPRFDSTIDIYHVSILISTCEDQEYKAFAELSLDLPFRYGSLTVMLTSCRPWIGLDVMCAFSTPGMEFFTVTEPDKRIEKDMNRRQQGWP